MKQIMKCLILILFSILIISSCKKEEKLPYPLSELPAATQRGANTFGCLLNGKPWVPGIYVWQPQYIDLTASYDEDNKYDTWGNFLSIKATYATDFLYESIQFNYKPIFSKGEISGLQVDTSDYRANLGTFKYRKLNTDFNNKFNITKLDTIHNIVSGTFQFSFIDYWQNDTVTITNGRFDIPYGEW